jgi:hypothetical protein
MVVMITIMMIVIMRWLHVLRPAVRGMIAVFHIMNGVVPPVRMIVFPPVKTGEPRRVHYYPHVARSQVIVLVTHAAAFPGFEFTGVTGDADAPLLGSRRSMTSPREIWSYLQVALSRSCMAINFYNRNRWGKI